MKKRTAAISLLLVVFIATINESYAQTISACVSTSSGNLRIVSSSTDCKKTENFISWNQQGPQSPRVVIKDGDGQEIGRLISIGMLTNDYGGAFNGYFVLNDYGYIMPIGFLSGHIAADNFFYDLNDCSGTAYSFDYPIGTVVRNPLTGNLYYTDKTVAPAAVNIHSVLGGPQTSCWNIEPGTFYENLALPRYIPNDPNITGVVSSTFKLPLTIEEE